MIDVVAVNKCGTSDRYCFYTNANNGFIGKIAVYIEISLEHH